MTDRITHIRAVPALETDLEVARRLVLETGRLVMARYGRVERETKAHDEPVTEADREANTHLVEGLSNAFSGDGILAEESAPRPEWWHKPRVWCIDPIDGTKEFLAQNGEFAVMVGLAVGSRPALGVVLLPARDVLYWGGPELGAFEERPAGSTPKALRVSDTSDIPSMYVAISRSHRSRRVDEMSRLLGITREQRSGSTGIKLGMVARGDVDLYLHPSRGTKRWDSCGPEAILVGAGGRLTDCRGRLIDYDTDEVENTSGLIASNGRRHDEIVERVRPVVESAGL